MPSRSKRRATGFTLVEMLVVVVIITILAAILVPAIFYAQRRARNTRIAIEIGTMKQALEAYKLKYNEYPPNFNDNTKVVNHLRYCFPRRAADDITPTGLDPAEALVFWLRGFSNNPQYPIGKLDADAKSLAGRASFYEFDKTRLVDHDTTADGWVDYEAPYSQNTPYLYFANVNYSAASYVAPNTENGQVKPYLRDGGSEYADPNTFQIIAAGQDGTFGTATASSNYPGGSGYTPGDRDNITSFSEGRTLEDRIP